MDRRVNRSSPGSYKRSQAESALKIDQFAKSRKYTPIKKKLIGEQEKKIVNYYQQVQQQEKSKERKRQRYTKDEDEISGADEASDSQSESKDQKAAEPEIKIWRKEDLTYNEVEQKEAELKRLKRQKYNENKKKRARGGDEPSLEDESPQPAVKRRKVDSVIQGVQDFTKGDATVNIIGDPFQGGSGSRDVDDDSFSEQEADPRNNNSNGSSINKNNLNNTPSPKKNAEKNNNQNNKKKEKKISIRGVDRSNPYYSAMVEFERKKLEQEEKEKQIRISKHEKQVASKNRNKKKQQSFQQTQRGQPLMKNKINALLDKIEYK